MPPTITSFINPTSFAPAKFMNIGVIYNLITPLLMIGAAILFLVTIISAAFTYLTAGGNAENIKKAQKSLMFAIIGLVFVISAYLIMKIIAFVFNLTLPF
ncbi:hypothetical protein CO083_00395 [Candidatus Roizmanbacteria bacterium CG_4_9_14_0_8_um_filter_34_12]|uniref:Uncharacterized protein n=1 Tax=Candidatus Roizmanbacteria bacterium CG_4_9_14_0_8_um_filter_34_12 TaxID=1974840 RepID=A0A2M8DE93_9BACT|nr:MAG: hypothetical protein CO083_00395 [Candidatus Roizmanbacteria bacterium CG_4_9_14_0_8_um_filter_34_12]